MDACFFFLCLNFRLYLTVLSPAGSVLGFAKSILRVLPRCSVPFNSFLAFSASSGVVWTPWAARPQGHGCDNANLLSARCMSKLAQVA